MSNFILGARSLNELQGVNASLVAVVQRAIQLTAVDFAVIDGVRTLAEQREYVRTGASQTIASRHLTGHAVDLAPFVGNTVRWELALMYPIALAMRQAARESGVPLRWGGCWSPELTNSDELPEDMVADYVARRRAAGLRAFVDAGHYELPAAQYPG